MEITENSSLPLENQSCQTSSQGTNVNSISRVTRDVEVQTVDEDQTAPVNKNETRKIVKIGKVFKNVRTVQDSGDLKQLKKKKTIKIVRTPENPKTASKRKDKTSKVGSSGKKSNSKSKVGDTLALGGEKNSSEESITPKEQKDDKTAALKKPPHEKFISKPTKELLLSDCVSLSRDWTAIRKTYTRSNIGLSVKAANDYDALTQKPEKTDSNVIELATAPIEPDSVGESNNNEPSRQQLQDNGTNDRTDKPETDTPASISIEKTAHGERNSSNISDDSSILSELNSDNLYESPGLQSSAKTTILKQTKCKSKRKTVHFSDKIDLPIDCLNRNDILLEIDNVTAKSHEEGTDRVNDILVNDTVNTSLKVDTMPCVVNEHSVQNQSRISTSNQKRLDNLSNVSADDALIASIEIDKIQCPITENPRIKKNLLKTKNQERSLNHLSSISVGNATDATIKVDQIKHPIQDQSKTKMPTKIIQKDSNITANTITLDDKSKQDTTKENIKKRGRPRKVDVVTGCRNKNVLKTKIIPRNKITKSENRNLTALPTTIAESGTEGEKISEPSVCEKRPRKVLDNKLLFVARQRQKSKETLPVKEDTTQSDATPVGAETISSQPVLKRKRGRPRKYPKDDSCDADSPSAKRMKLDQSNDKYISETIVNGTSNKENEQVILTNTLAGSDETTLKEKCSQEVSRSGTTSEDGTPKVLTSDNAGDVKTKLLEEPLLKQNSDEKNEEVACGKKSQNSDVCSEVASDVQSKKEDTVQAIDNGFGTEVVSKQNMKEQEVQALEIQDLVIHNASVCPKIDNSNEVNEKVKLNLKHAEKISCSDANSFNEKTKEQEVQCTELDVASEILVNSDGDKITDGSSLCRTYERQRLKGLAEVAEPPNVISIVNTDEDEHLKQKTSSVINLEMSNLETSHKLNNNDVNTLKSERRQKRSRKTSNSTDFVSSEMIYDKDQANDLISKKKYRSKRKKTANVKLLLKKLRPVPRKTKRKRKTHYSKSDVNKNSVTKDQSIMKTFVCGVCRQVYDSFREVNYHIMSFHNGLARINDDTPFSTEEEISAFTQTLKKLKKLQCLQPGCGKKFVSVAGYKYHRDICGVEVPKATCKICGRILKATSLENHMLHSHTNINNSQQNVVEQEGRKEDEKGEDKFTSEVILDELPRRGAAVKALKKMENFIKTQKFTLEEKEIEIESDDDSVADSDYEEDLSEEDECVSEKPQHFSMEMLDSWKGNIKTPADVSEEICKEMAESWKQSLSENGKLKCDKKGCGKEFTELSEMKSHLQHCKARVWICSLCNRSYVQGVQLLNHMRRSHRIESSRKNTEESPRRSNYSYISNLLDTPSDHSGSSKLLKPYLPAVEWSMEFRKKHHRNELFSQWKPVSTNWVRMKTQHLTDYLPPLKESAFIKSSEGNSSDWTRLSLFECPKWADNERQKTFFVGGSVWGSAWCPTGITCNTVQYLALAANNPAPHRLTDCSSQKGLIQLWDIGILGAKSSSTPKLALAIAHESGSIWDMEWCPSGCWEESSDVQNEKKPDGILPRLGLLAVACSNSTVRVYSIPHPHSIVKTKENLPVFRSRPVVVLLCPDSTPNINCQRTLCTKVSWQKTNGHPRLAAGFGNGLVCVWNLTSSSPLLVASQFGGQLTLCPYLSFPAHGACITGLVWIPVSDGQYLSTASYDRTVKVWNLEDHNWPSVVTKRGFITDIAWLPHWCGVFASLDDCYNVQHTSTFYKECGYYSFAPKTLSTHFGCIWSLSLSDWLNVEASGDASGEVIVTVLCQLMKLVDGIKLMSHRRVPLFRVSMEMFEDTDVNEKQAESVQGILSEHNNETAGSSRDNETPEKPVQQHSSQKDNSGINVDLKAYHTYEEAIEKFGLVLQDNNMENFSAIPEAEFRRIRQQETMSSYALDQYPLNSINKVSWNPNLGSHLWLFSAGQAGIARVCCVFGLHSDNLRNTVNKCKEKFRTAVDKL